MFSGRQLVLFSSSFSFFFLLSDLTVWLDAIFFTLGVAQPIPIERPVYKWSQQFLAVEKISVSKHDRAEKIYEKKENNAFETRTISMQGLDTIE